MANWNNPQLTSTYTNFLAEVKARDVDLATQFSGSPTNMPTGSIKWNSGTNIWQKWSGSAWGELTSTYQFPAIEATTGAFGGNVTISGSYTLDVGGSATASSFSCDGSTAPSNGIYLPAASTLGFSAGGSRQAALTSTGLKLGSGTAGCKLDVVGGIKVSGGITNGSHGYGFSSNDTDGGMYSNADNELTFKTNNTRRLTIQGDQLGVNINNPDAHLHVSNSNTNNSGAATNVKISNSEGSYEIAVDGDTAFHNADAFYFQNEGKTVAYGVWNSTGLGVNCFASYKLDVAGTARITSSLRVGSLKDSSGNAYKPDDLNISATNRVLYQVSNGNTFVLPSGTAGQYLKTNGSSSAPSWSTISTAGVVPIGGIIIWYGSEASIPSGWSICNGSTVGGYATPDLRNRFVLGAGTGDGAQTPGSTGGYEDAIVVSHTHTSSSTGTAHTHSGSTNSTGAHNHSFKASNRAGDEVSWGGHITKAFVGDHDANWFTQAADTDKIFDSENHTHTVTINSGGSHTHTINSEGVSGTDRNMPPYYCLCYIMRTS